jgi:hypothetical protein
MQVAPLIPLLELVDQVVVVVHLVEQELHLQFKDLLEVMEFLIKPLPWAVAVVVVQVQQELTEQMKDMAVGLVAQEAMVLLVP